MPKGKHHITKERAARLVENLKLQKGAPKSKLEDLPEGFSFEINAVRELINHPEAAHFIIRFGWKEKGKAGKTGGIAPVLCVADSNFNILDDDAGEQAPPATGISMTADTDANAMLAGAADPGTGGTVSEEFPTEGEGGGYLDEGDLFPPIAK